MGKTHRNGGRMHDDRYNKRKPQTRWKTNPQSVHIDSSLPSPPPPSSNRSRSWRRFNRHQRIQEVNNLAVEIFGSRSYCVGKPIQQEPKSQD
jgi:hypothetical protein